jgi:hypothetical protein
MPSRYYELLTTEEVCEALSDFLQKKYPLRTMPEVIWFSHDIPAQRLTVETATPIPADFSTDDVYDEGTPI